ALAVRAAAAGVVNGTADAPLEAIDLNPSRVPVGSHVPWDVLVVQENRHVCRSLLASPGATAGCRAALHRAAPARLPCPRRETAQTRRQPDRSRKKISAVAFFVRSAAGALQFRVSAPSCRRRSAVSSPGSVSHWLGLLKTGDSAAAQSLWQRYF